MTTVIIVKRDPRCSISSELPSICFSRHFHKHSRQRLKVIIYGEVTFCFKCFIYIYIYMNSYFDKYIIQTKL